MKNKLLISILLVLTLISVSAAPVRAETDNQDAADAYNAGLKYVQQDDYEHAALSFQKAIQCDPNFGDAYYNLGSLYEHFGDYETAIKAYEQVVAIEPRDYATTLKLANLYYALNMDDQALEYIAAIPEGTDEYQGALALKKKINTKSAPKAKQSAKTQTPSKSKATPTQSPQDNSMDGRTASGGYTDPDKTLISKYSSPTGITVDSKGNIYVASFGDNKIYTVTPDGANKVFAESTMIDGPIGIDADTAGNLYVANYNRDNILKISPSGNVNIFKSDVKKPYAVYVSGNVILVSEQGTNSVIMFVIK